jgi:hypothetical protein
MHIVKAFHACAADRTATGLLRLISITRQFQFCVAPMMEWTGRAEKRSFIST